MKSPESGIRILEVRVRNFRSLKEVNVYLDEMTVLIGGNNSGKTSFLEALHAAIGSGRRTISSEDVFLEPSENKVPVNRIITVDLLVRPVDANGSVIERFPQGFWLSLWGDGVSQDINDNDFVAIRTQMRRDAATGEYVTDRKFLADWQLDPTRWHESKPKQKGGSVNPTHIEPLALYFLDAKRDIQDELQNRGSFWHKLVSEPGLADQDIEKLEKSLTDLNEMILSGSAVFTHIQNHLNDLYQTVDSVKGSVSISPIPRNLRHLSKGIDVNFATKGAQNFPLVRHGMGTRSLAALLTFRAYMTWRQKNQNGEAVHAMLALEEPEAHLHPQAQRALFRQIEGIPGQRIVSTHSPYIAGQAQINQFRHFRKVGSNTIVRQIDVASLSDEEIRKINRMVMNTRGEMLYASVLVLFEGETEEQALPLIAEGYWQQAPNSMGVTFIGVGGAGNYLPFLRLANDFGIPWYIFSDGEPLVIKLVQSALNQIGISDLSACQNVVVLPDGHNFESYIVAQGYQEVISNMLDSVHSTTDYLGNYMTRMDGQPLNKATLRDYRSAGGRERALADVLSEQKTQLAKPLATAISCLMDSNGQCPQRVRQLLEVISSEIGVEKKEMVVV